MAQKGKAIIACLALSAVFASIGYGAHVALQHPEYFILPMKTCCSGGVDAGLYAAMLKAQSGGALGTLVFLALTIRALLAKQDIEP